MPFSFLNKLKTQKSACKTVNETDSYPPKFNQHTHSTRNNPINCHKRRIKHTKRTILSATPPKLLKNIKISSIHSIKIIARIVQKISTLKKDPGLFARGPFLQVKTRTNLTKQRSVIKHFCILFSVGTSCRSVLYKITTFRRKPFLRMLQLP